MTSRIAEDHLIALLLEHEDNLALAMQEAATYRHLLLASLDALSTCVEQRQRSVLRVRDLQQQIARLMGTADDATRE